MQDSHTPVAADETADRDRLRLVPTATLGLALLHLAITQTGDLHQSP